MRAAAFPRIFYAAAGSADWAQSASGGAAGLEIDVLATDEHGGVAVDDQRRFAGRILNADARRPTSKLVMLAKIIDPGMLLTAVDVEQAIVRAMIIDRALRLGNV
jgi:hypothetical protein